MNHKQITLDDINYTIVEMRNVFNRMILEIKTAKLFAGFTNYLDDERGLEYAFLQVVAGVEASESASMIKDLVQCSVEVPGDLHDDEIFDKHFSSNYDHLVDLAFEAFEINFGKSIESLKKKLTKIGILSPKSGALPSKKDPTVK